MKEKWIVTAWASPMEMRALHIVDGATSEQVKSYASRLWAWFGADLFAICIDHVGTGKHFYIGG